MWGALRTAQVAIAKDEGKELAGRTYVDVMIKMAHTVDKYEFCPYLVLFPDELANAKHQVDLKARSVATPSKRTFGPMSKSTGISLTLIPPIEIWMTSASLCGLARECMSEFEKVMVFCCGWEVDAAIHGSVGFSILAVEEQNPTSWVSLVVFGAMGGRRSARVAGHVLCNDLRKLPGRQAFANSKTAATSSSLSIANDTSLNRFRKLLILSPGFCRMLMTVVSKERNVGRLGAASRKEMVVAKEGFLDKFDCLGLQKGLARMVGMAHTSVQVDALDKIGASEAKEAGKGGHVAVLRHGSAA
ncbi:hypothetical protein GIB67_019406 [Kingdonia uniflora]|uniref:Uncharacterized protein n=1 Tax=Kingdonia uniflora TaxID=39325 RepID=A0A7J7MBL7_9MAGN|nr:hypothetical protein GIB67_019406 [Kingdonia uniflora]